MAGATPVYNERNILEVPLDFHSLTFFNSNYKKLVKCNPSFRQDDFFSILSKYWQVSKNTVMLSKFSFLKKGKELGQSFEW